MKVKVRERAIRFVFKDSTFDNETLLTKRCVDSFRISSLQAMAVEMYKFLNDINPAFGIIL